jgi:hypothetical protein
MRLRLDAPPTNGREVKSPLVRCALTSENVMRRAFASTKGPSFSITFNVAVAATGVVAAGVAGVGVGDVLDVVGEVVELLHATTVTAIIIPPRAARRIKESSESV